MEDAVALALLSFLYLAVFARILDDYAVQHIEDLLANVPSCRDSLPNLTEAKLARAYCAIRCAGQRTFRRRNCRLPPAKRGHEYSPSAAPLQPEGRFL